MHFLVADNPVGLNTVPMIRAIFQIEQ